MTSSRIHARFDTVRPLNGARLVRGAGGLLDLETPALPWTYALLLPLGVEASPSSAVGIRTSVDLDVVSGTIGVSLTDRAAQSPVGQEALLSAGAGRVTLELGADTPDAVQLCVRTGPGDAGRVRVYDVSTTVRCRFDVTDVIDDVLPSLMRAPGAEALDAVAAALSARGQQDVSAAEIGALACSRAPIAIPFERILDDEDGRGIREDLDRLLALLPTYDPSRMDPRSGYLGRDYFEKFFRQSTIRVYHLIRQLRELGLTGGRVLEIGSLFGQFALALRRLGFDVTVVDRYRAYGGALDGYTSHLRASGIQVVETDRSDEEAVIAGLGSFDVVMAMAVIEHIPHTPREFLGMLASHVAPGGVVALDTPNVARYWNRRRLADGLSIHQSLQDQFYSGVPWEGHHREYTASELTWMLEQVGCRDVRSRLFDYNALQFPELSAQHLEALLAAAVDPSLADTVLAAGRTPARDGALRHD